MNDLSKRLFEHASSMNKAMVVGINAGEASAARRIKSLEDALRPFVHAYKQTVDPGTSDLYDEQPHNVYVTLGDCRKAERVLR